MDKVQHFEIPADDVARARKFYEDIFGWQTKEFPMPGMTYVGLHTGPVDEKNMWKEPGFINGGLLERGMLKHPTIAATVEDIDATLAKIESQGGLIVKEKYQVGEMGWYAYVEDTEGNVIGVWQEMKK